MTRTALIRRETRETNITIELNLDGTGKADVTTGIGFFDHMLTAFARFAYVDLHITAKGDLHVDQHHTIEDVGICLGEAMKQSLGDKRGIRRAAHAYMPMDESLAFVALDISNRPMLCFAPPLPNEMIGDMPAQLAEEFFRAVANACGMTLHMSVTGRNAHHMVEALFKAFGKAFDEAKQIDPRIVGEIPSTKGLL